MGHPDVRAIQCRSILTKTGGFLHSYTHTLNPYAGCAFGASGCGVYCYVAESPVGRFARAPWGFWVDAKTNAAPRLEAEIAKLEDPTRLRIFMSSATDPYQPVEAKLQITRSLLEVLRRRPVGLLVVQTRSPLVKRDFDLLADMSFAWLSMTVETDDDAVRRLITPTCPSIPQRVQAMQLARERGIHVQAAISPVLPHNSQRFADMLTGCADRVVIDTFTSGDGSGGQRTARRSLPNRFEQLGWGDWRDEAAAHRLFAVLQDRLPAETTVTWSVEGFNSL